MDGSGQDNDAAAGEQPHPPSGSGHVLLDALMGLMAALGDDAFMDARDDADDLEAGILRFGGHNNWGGFDAVPASGEATPRWSVLPSGMDVSGGQSNGAEAGEQPQPIPAPSSYERGSIHSVVIVVPSDGSLHLFAFRAGGNGHGDMMSGYGDDAYSGGGFGAVPASDKAIQELEKAAVGETRETVCGVCLESFEEDDKIRKMPCSHGFHESCIFDWLRVSRLCPHCRYAMPAETGWL
jgi:hypothetical protein